MTESVTLGVNHVLGYDTCRGVGGQLCDTLGCENFLTNRAFLVTGAFFLAGGLYIDNPVGRGVLLLGDFLCYSGQLFVTNRAIYHLVVMAESVTLGVNHVLGYDTCRGVGSQLCNTLACEYFLTSRALHVTGALFLAGWLCIYNPVRGGVLFLWDILGDSSQFLFA